jgi:hypothetical protein
MQNLTGGKMGVNKNGVLVNENNLDSLAQPAIQDRNILQMQYSININTVNPYIFMDHTYKGSAGYRDGSYLIPFSRESSYISRKQLAHFKNYLRPVLRAMIEPCFTEPADRKVTTETGQTIEKSLFTEFLDDCDSADTFIQDFAQQVVALARRHGVAFCVMDNHPSTAQPETVSQAISGRIYPYVYAKRAWEVEDYQCDAFGNLLEIIFTEAPVKTKSTNGTVTTEKRWRKWTQQESIVLTKSKNNSHEWIELSRAVHGLGVVPVIILFSDAPECKSEILVDPPLYDIAKLNYVIYNQSAEIRDQERAQAFSIFYCQGVPPGDLVISNNTYINLPNEASISPGYASPNFSIIAGLVANQEQNRKDLFAISEQNGVVGVQTQTSGVALAYDFYAHESVLKQTSKMATTLELCISEMFKLYTHEQFIYVVIYPSDFAPMGVDNEVSRFDKILRIPGLNPTLAAKIQEKLARMVLADEDDTIITEVTDAIKATITTTASITESTTDTGDIVTNPIDQSETKTGEQNVKE